MRAKTIAAFLAATAIVGACALPLGASAAKPRRVRQQASVATDLQMRGTNGFHLDLFTSDGGGVSLLAERQADRAAISYFSLRHHVRDSFEAERLNVRIGHLGHFRGRFVPTATKQEKLDPGCKGDPPTTEKGFFVGSFDFRGERGYTTVHSHRVRASVTRRPAAICTYPEGPLWRPSNRHEGFHLVAADEEGDLLFDARYRAATKDEPSLSTFQASANGKRVGDFEVSHFVSDLGFEPEPEPTFQVPDLAEPPAEVTIAPPPPFSGSATFHLDDPRTASWTGDLAVEMPGLGKVPLTGEGIDAGLCKGSSCTKTLPKVLQPVLEAPEGVIVAVSVAKPKGDR